MNRTIIVNTADHGPVTVLEPAWCVGEHTAGEARVDITHSGPDTGLTISTTRGPVTILSAGVEQRPFTDSPTGRAPFLSVELNGDWFPFDPDRLRDLADDLAGYADWLRIRAHQLAAIISTTEAGQR